MRLRFFFASVLAAAFFAATANGAVLLQLVIDPIVEADSGIPPVNGMTVTSVRSGPLTYHVFALDDNDGSQGISSYDISVVNSTPNQHRSPTTSWNDADENGPFNAGFSLLRTAGSNGGVFQASQPLPGTVPVLITGFGQTAGNFPDKIPQAEPGSFALTTSGQWGNYATIDPYFGKRWLFIGEGRYAEGAPPAISPTSVVTYYDENFRSLVSSVAVLPDCFGRGCNPIIESFFVDDRDLSPDGSGMVFFPGDTITGTLEVQGVFDELTWTLESLLGPGGVDYTAQATVNATTGEFSWTSPFDAPTGRYNALIRAADDAGSDSGTLSFRLVPEPATLSLLGLAMIGLVGLGRRR